MSTNNLTTPVVILPTADHIIGGELRIRAPNNTDFATLIDTANGFLIKGKAANNGSIVLEPGNVAGAGLASAAIVTPRLDQPAMIIFDANGTTTGNALSLRTNGGTEYFAVKGGTDATAPGEVTLANAVTLDASSGDLIITGGTGITFQGLALLVTLGDSGLRLQRGSIVKAQISDGGAAGAGQIALGDHLGGGTTGFKAPATLSGGLIYTLPTADGASGDVLSTDGSKNLSFVPNGGGSGPWTVYAPTPTYTAGTITVTATDCAFSQSGKDVNVRIHLTFTVGTDGLTSSTIAIPLPVAPLTNGQNLATALWIDGTYPALLTPAVGVFNGSDVILAMVPIVVTFMTGHTYDVVLGPATYEAA